MSNDRLRLKPRNGGRAVVLDEVRCFTEHSRDAIPFHLKFQNPAWIVWRDLKSLNHVGCDRVSQSGKPNTRYSSVIVDTRCLH
jgi:hypothetical protein